MTYLARRLPLVCLPLLVAPVAGCGGGAAFQNLFPDNRASDVDAVLARLPRPARAEEPANSTGNAVIVVSKGGDRPGLVAFGVQSGERMWSADLAVDSPPFVGGGVVVVKSGDDLVSLSLADGSELGTRDLDGMTLYGVSASGGIVAATVGTGAGAVATTGRYGEVWVMNESLGNLTSPIRADKLMGAPAVAGDLVFVPWDRQMISALDSATGAEVCRLNVTDEMVGYVLAVPEGIFYGSKGAFRLVSGSASGTRDGGEYAPVDWADPEYPGQPALYPDAFEGVTDGNPSARARVRLAWYPAAPGAGRSTPFADDRLYFVYYRHVVAVRSTDRQLAWVRGLDEPAAEVAATAGGIYVVEPSGAVRFLAAADGSELWSGDVGTPVRRAGFSVEGFVPQGEPVAAADLRRQVMDALLDPDNQAVPVRRMILTLFGRSDNPDVSRDLLVVLRNNAMPADMRDAAARALRLRRDGAGFLKDALADHFDYLHDVPAPPVGVISGALMNMNERSAAAALVTHLFEPDTDMGDLEELVRAVVALGDPAVVTPLEKFFLMYHADSEMLLNPGILQAAAMGVLAHGGAEGEAFIERAAADRFASDSLRTMLADMLAARRSAAPAIEGRPASVGRDEFVAFVTSRVDALGTCLAEARTRRPGLSQIDVGITVTGDGRVVDLVVAPSDAALSECLKPRIEALGLPQFQGQQDHYVVPIVL